MKIDLSFESMLRKKNITYLSMKRKKDLCFLTTMGKMVTIMNKPFKAINEFFISHHFLLAALIIFSLLCSPACQ